MAGSSDAISQQPNADSDPGAIALPGTLTDRTDCGCALENGARIMCGLLLKCAALIVIVHGFRVIGRIAGARWSGLALGLPSTTAIVLILCGSERGSPAAIDMADSSLLGIAAAVALPLVYAQAVRLGWCFPASFAAAVAGYLVIAIGVGCLPTVATLPRIGVASFAILAATHWARRIPTPEGATKGASLSSFQAMAARTVIPAIYGLVLGVVQRMAGPSWAGLVSTFPSMSLVVLAVTHLEAGPAEASRIARVLPAGNTSTLAFLAAFRLISPAIGLGSGTIAGYSAALVALLIIEGFIRPPAFFRVNFTEVISIWRSKITSWSTVWQTRLQWAVFRALSYFQRGPRNLLRRRPRHRGGFAPLFETLAW
jgi:hypothetical protein